MDQKLLLKEKDYELLAAKRTVPFKHSFNDPLINPPRKNKRPPETRLPHPPPPKT
jgi:hypothetical protein